MKNQNKYSKNLKSKIECFMTRCRFLQLKWTTVKLSIRGMHIFKWGHVSLQDMKKSMKQNNPDFKEISVNAPNIFLCSFDTTITTKGP